MRNIDRFKAAMAQNWLEFAHLAAAKAGNPMLGWAVDCDQMMVTLRASIDGKPYRINQTFDDFGAMPDQGAMIAELMPSVEASNDDGA